MPRTDPLLPSHDLGLFARSCQIADMKGDRLTFRKMASEDAVSYRKIRLKALIDNPESFRATFQEEQGNGIEVFSDRLTRLPIFGAFDGDDIVGMVGLYLDQRERFSHKATLWGLFVRTEYRSCGVGERLLKKALSEAEAQSQQVILAVASTGNSAIALYERNGFERYGIEPRAMKDSERYVDELLMVRFSKT